MPDTIKLAEQNIVPKGTSKKSSLSALKTPDWFKETQVDPDVRPEAFSKNTNNYNYPTYKKAKELLPTGKTLDYGAGKGVGAKKVGFGHMNLFQAQTLHLNLLTQQLYS